MATRRNGPPLEELGLKVELGVGIVPEDWKRPTLGEREGGGMGDHVFLSETLSLPIKQLLCSDPIGRAVYETARQEKWGQIRFLEELALAFGKAYSDLLAAELQRRMMQSPSQPPSPARH